MARRIRRERGRPRSDWSKDPLIVRDWWTWAREHGTAETSVNDGRRVMYRFHEWLIPRLKKSAHGQHYYEPDQAKDFVTWEEARAWKEFVKSQSVGTNRKKRMWEFVRSFFVWRAEAYPTKERYDTDVSQIKKFWTSDVFGETKRQGVAWMPFQPDPVNNLSRREVVERILEAAGSYATIGGDGYELPSEDLEIQTLLYYTSGRAQLVGLRRDQVHDTIGALITPQKGGDVEVFAPPRKLLAMLTALHDRKPGDRMVFRGTGYPYFDGEQCKTPGARCEYEERGSDRCEATTNLWTYTAPDRDRVYCDDHIHREIGVASARNNKVAARSCRRVEAALHRLYPELREQVYNRTTRQFEVRPVHVHPHRWRKTFVTIAREMGRTKDEVAKVSKHKSKDVLEGTYFQPELEAMRAISEDVTQSGDGLVRVVSKDEELLATVDALIASQPEGSQVRTILQGARMMLEGVLGKVPK